MSGGFAGLGASEATYSIHKRLTETPRARLPGRLLDRT